MHTQQTNAYKRKARGRASKPPGVGRPGEVEGNHVTATLFWQKEKSNPQTFLKTGTAAGCGGPWFLVPSPERDRGRRISHRTARARETLPQKRKFHYKK